jgi:uncharacterized LabA/DUF88 family protein
MKPQTHIYIDGFNLFYGAVKGTPYKWLDVNRMCELLLPNNDIQAIKYFTAKVDDRPHKPRQGTNQQFYLRALRTLPNLEIIFGHFLTTTIRMALANPVPGRPKTVEVLKTEEKGSDVNIAAHLVHDAHQGVFEVAVLITNDSDLLTPTKIVRRELGLPVGVVSPFPRIARVLQHEATFKKKIRKNVLAASQFPPMLSDVNGVFHKPKEW